MQSIGVTWQGVADFIAVCVVLYFLLRLARLIRALRIAALLGFGYGAAVVAWHLNLAVTARVFEDCIVALMGIIVIVFQPEIRRALLKADAFSLFGGSFPVRMDDRNKAIASAAFLLSRERTGALIVILNRVPIDDLTDGGLELNADISTALLLSLFQKTSPVHDGAVLIRDNTVSHANVIVPLTERNDVPAGYGTRHRAAMGIAEKCDGTVVVVSEERGEVSVMTGHQTAIIGSEEELMRRLAGSQGSKRRLSFRLVARWFVNDWKLKATAVSASVLLLGGAALLFGNSERILLAPVEFDNLAHGLDVAVAEVPRIEVEVRGKSWLIDENELSQMAVRLDLRGRHAGIQRIAIDLRSLPMPPGVRIIRVVPETVLVRIEQRSTQ